MTTWAADDKAGETKHKVQKTDAEWKKILTPMQYKVLRKEGTEHARTGRYWDDKRAGTFHCAGCGEALFDAKTKFKSGTGWPSFWQPVKKQAVGTKVDKSFFSVRTEVHCASCGGHLGHIFDDGPEPTGKRYCINSVSLVHSADKGKKAPAPKAKSPAMKKSSSKR
jgi:peptide-methionine (R)-S-oxide reductase